MMENTEYFLRELDLSNFRCFPKIHVDFHKKLTVFVAPNGGGKTAILDAIAVALRRFVDDMAGVRISKGFDDADFQRVPNDLGLMDEISSVEVVAKGVFRGDDISWQRGRNLQEQAKGRTTTAGMKDLRQVAADLNNMHRQWMKKEEKKSPLFPLIAYYGTGRLWSSMKLTKNKKTKSAPLNARKRGYVNCLTPSSHYKFFVDWFRRFSYEARQEETDRNPSPHTPQKPLGAVRQAVNTVLLEPTGWGDLEWDFAEDVPRARHDIFGKLPIDSLSDGIRTMIGLVADIAYRTTILNPHLGPDSALETPGIVLIDEIDMHLHPEWQQIVLPSLHKAFPLVQFIVTTHSPQVLTTVGKENIRVLVRDDQGAWSAETPRRSALARSSEDALAYIMDVDPQPNLEILETARLYEQMVKAGEKESKRARALRGKMDEAGYEIPEADFAVWEFLAEKNRKEKLRG